MTNPNSGGSAGQLGITGAGSDFNQHSFLVKQALNRVSTMKIVKVTKVKQGAGALATTGTVDVLPLVNQTDGVGNSTKHGTVFSLQYIRVQGGKNAVIMDPEVGDIGLAIVSDRDTSAVIKKKGQANPGSRRRFDISDGVYLGGILNGVPEQYIRFTSTGVIIADKNENIVTLQSGSNAITVKPKDGSNVILGGDGSTGTYAYVSTVSGPSTNVKARIS